MLNSDTASTIFIVNKNRIVKCTQTYIKNFAKQIIFCKFAPFFVAMLQELIKRKDVSRYYPVFNLDNNRQMDNRQTPTFMIRVHSIEWLSTYLQV